MDSTKSAPGQVTPKLCFCSLCDLQVTWCNLLRPGHETSTHSFSCSGGPDAVSKKARRVLLRRTYVFASGGICGSRIAFWCIQDVKLRHTILYDRVGLVWIT
jgi:hypothetical protein